MAVSTQGYPAEAVLSGLSGQRQDGDAVANAYIGFYWTLPVPWAGFRRLPANVADAEGNAGQ